MGLYIAKIFLMVMCEEKTLEVVTKNFKHKNESTAQGEGSIQLFWAFLEKRFKTVSCVETQGNNTIFTF